MRDVQKEPRPNFVNFRQQISVLTFLSFLKGIMFIPVLTYVALCLAIALGIVCARLSWRDRRRNHVVLELERAREMLGLAERVGGVGVWTVRQKDHKLYWSDRVYTIHGRDKALGPPSLVAAIAYYDPTDRGRIVELMNDALKRGASYEFNARIIAEDGRTKHVLSRAVCQKGIDGEIDHVFGVIIETSQIDEAQQFGIDELRRLRA